MSYQVCDTNGYVGDLCSGGGLQDMIDAAYETENDDLISFFEAGQGDAAVLRQVLAGIDNPIFKDLKRLAEKCDEIVIINNGIDSDEKKE